MKTFITFLTQFGPNIQVFINLLMVFELIQIWNASYFSDFEKIVLRLPDKLEKDYSIYNIKHNLKMRLKAENKISYSIEEIISISKSCRFIIWCQWATIILTSILLIIIWCYESGYLSLVLNENIMPEYLNQRLTGFCSAAILILDIILICIRSNRDLLKMICYGDNKYKKVHPYQVALFWYYFKTK